MQTISRFLLGLLIGITLALATVRFCHAEQRYTPIVDKTIGSVVKITASYVDVVEDTTTKKMDLKFGSALGAGVIVSTTGHILTCQHVISGHPFLIDVQLQGNTTAHYQATVLRRSFNRDIALLKVSSTTAFQAAKLSPAMPRVGDEVVAIGHPHDYDWSVTAGIVSGLKREGLAINLLQTDAAINPGNSGGPLFNMDGQIVGLNESVYAGSNNLGFAVSVDEIRNFMEVFRGLDQVQ
jgi:S1-C subfamily serine protease